MTSSRSDKEVANQFIIYDDDGSTYFQSYRTIIAKKSCGKTYLDENWDYSVTTGKYRNQFLGESKRETEAKIKAGIYEVVDLNGRITKS